MAQTALDPQTQARQRRRRIIVSVIVASIALHFIGAILAGIWIVARFILATPTTFEVKKEIRIAAEERLVLERYPEYAAYAARTKRLIPFVF